jgi:hypothetical protein
VERAQTEPLAAQPRTNDVDIDEGRKTSPGTRKGMAPAHQVRLICAYLLAATIGQLHDRLRAVSRGRRHEGTNDYAGDGWHAVVILQLDQDGRILCDTRYYTQASEAPEWRSACVEQI